MVLSEEFDNLAMKIMGLIISFQKCIQECIMNYRKKEIMKILNHEH